MSCQMCVYASFVMAGGIACIQSYNWHCVIVLCIRIIVVTIGVYLHFVYKLADVSACIWFCWVRNPCCAVVHCMACCVWFCIECVFLRFVNHGTSDSGSCKVIFRYLQQFFFSNNQTFFGKIRITNWNYFESLDFHNVQQINQDTLHDTI